VSAQFKAFRNPYKASAKGSPYLVVLQSDLLDTYPAVMVAPLQPIASSEGPSRLRPRFEVEGAPYVLNVLEMAPVRRAHLGAPVAELDRFVVINAYDALISGAYA